MTEPARMLPSVWRTGQRDLVEQLSHGGYAHGTDMDTHGVLPAVAAHAITTYSRPGDLVLDPDCGSGTVLVEALRSDRRALGLTAVERMWTLARANVSAVKAAGAWRDGAVLHAHPTALVTTLAAGLAGQVELVLTTFRTPTSKRGPSGMRADRGHNLAATLQHVAPIVRPGGHVVVVARPSRHPDCTADDVISVVIAAGTSSGLVPADRCVALTARLRGTRLVPHASLAERRDAARSCLGGAPLSLGVHHEVVVFRRPYELQTDAAACGRDERVSGSGFIRVDIAGLGFERRIKERDAARRDDLIVAACASATRHGHNIERLDDCQVAA
jgi:modification methylase